jgi:hypothetical protein
MDGGPYVHTQIPYVLRQRVKNINRKVVFAVIPA